MKKRGPKYVIMNGSSGCMPDNYMYAESIREAIDSIKDLFYDLPLPRGAIVELKKYHIYYFRSRSHEYGADYVEIAENTEMTYEDIESL